VYIVAHIDSLVNKAHTEAMEKATFILPTKPKRVNQFFELCKFFADTYNASSPTKVSPNRFMRDCKANRRAYELAQIDFYEIVKLYDIPVKDRAKLLFRCLKKRKA
jgi:hypothetical protein